MSYRVIDGHRSWYPDFLHPCKVIVLILPRKNIFRQILQSREKGRDLTQSYDISPYTSRNVKRATQITPQKSSIEHRLRTDLGQGYQCA